MMTNDRIISMCSLENVEEFFSHLFCNTESSEAAALYHKYTQWVSNLQPKRLFKLGGQQLGALAISLAHLLVALYHL